MALFERVMSRLIPSVRESEERAQLIGFVDQAGNEFQKIVDFHARHVKDSGPRRFRGLLENRQIALAFINEKKGPIFRLTSSEYYSDGRVFLVAVINAGKLTDAPFEERNKAMSSLMGEFESLRGTLKGSQIFPRYVRGELHWDAPAHSALKSSVVNPKRAYIKLCG